MDFLIIDDEKSIRDAACYLIEEEGHYAEGASNSTDGLARLKEDKWDAVILDMNLGQESGLEVLPIITKAHPNLPVVMFTGMGTVKFAVESMKLGAVDFLEKPFARGHFISLVARLNKIRQMGRQIENLESQVEEARHASPNAIYESQSEAMISAMAVLNKAAATPATILILGESGTGKSMVARSLHERSPFASKPFVTVSCPSLSKELLQSELFGHVKGSFTGALKDHWGKVRAADGGTLFLDEIGELPMEIQPKLLRLLQEREYERVGENTARPANIRIIAATNRDLRAAVQAGEFREDLYYRLSVISVRMPSLRERPQDVLHFANHYLEFFAKQFRSPARQFSKAAESRLTSHAWPGNLRELRNVIERSVILGTGKSLEVGEFGPHVTSKPEVNGVTPVELMSLQELEDNHIRRIIDASGNLQEACKILGIDQATLYRKRKKLGLLKQEEKS